MCMLRVRRLSDGMVNNDMSHRLIAIDQHEMLRSDDSGSCCYGVSLSSQGLRCAVADDKKRVLRVSGSEPLSTLDTAR